MLVSSASKDSAQALVGTRLKDRWHLDALLGVGGMAWVFAATHRNKSRVAIKLLVPHLSHSPDVRRRFLREGYAANSVGHPGAVKVFDDDVTEDGLAFLVMELLEGKTLADLRREAGGRLDPKTALRYSEKVLDVLMAAHERGIVHRDVKPSNIFVSRDGSAKLVDFGIARICEVEQDDEATQTGLLLGSAPFMPPEQARGRWDLVDARSDVWSLGATLFQLLAGRAVHEAGTPRERLVAAMSQPARSLASVMPAMPLAVVQLVDRALAFEREARWQSAQEMQSGVRESIGALGDFGSTLFVGAPPPEISYPDASSGPLLFEQPAPAAPVSIATLRDEPRTPETFAATLVLGSDPYASREPIDPPPDASIEPALADESELAARDTPPPLAVPIPQTSLAALAGPSAPSAVSGAPAPREEPRPLVRPIEIRAPHPTPAKESAPAASSPTDRTRRSLTRRSPVMVAGVIAIVVGGALLALAGLGVFTIRHEAARAEEAAALPLVAPERAPVAATPTLDAAMQPPPAAEASATGVPPLAGETSSDAVPDAKPAPRVAPRPAPKRPPRRPGDPYSAR